MIHQELSTIIEELAVEIVLIEHTDTDEMEDISNLLSAISLWAEEHSEPFLLKTIESCDKLIHSIMSGTEKTPEATFKSIVSTISEIQYIARKTNDFNSLTSLSTDGVPDKSNSDTLSELKQPDVEKQTLPEKATRQLRHPENLPEHINSELYGDFLSLKKSSLDKMESLILFIEKQNDKQSIDELKRHLHTIKGESGFYNLSEIERLCHLLEDLLGFPDISTYCDLFFNCVDWLRFTIDWCQGKNVQLSFDFAKLSEQLMIAISNERTRSIDNTDNEINKTEEQLQELPSQAEKMEQTPSQPCSSSGILKETLHVDAERLDKIIDMIGELVVAESMLVQSNEIIQIDSQEVNRLLSQINKITRGLQETGLSLRMLPIRQTFQKMERIARDTAKKACKSIHFNIQGEETELDKSVIEKISDPLMHMIRNAIDHGVESTRNERLQSGKPDIASVEIRAFHKGGNIQIEIEDDGRGLNTEEIIAKAYDSNIISETPQSERDIHQLIFEPGFSTCSEITDLSGRGVGMNVVKSCIEELRGQIEIKSESGKGALFTLKIPLTLAIIDGMLVRVDNERYIIPALSIITSTLLNRSNYTSVFGKGDMVDIQGELMPLTFLNTSETEKKRTVVSDGALIIVIEEDEKKAAIVVDELLGIQQIVIKPLGESMKNIAGISGGAIMPDGRVGLIADVSELVQTAHDYSRPD